MREIRGQHSPGLKLEELRRILCEVHGVEVEKFEARPELREWHKEKMLEALANTESQVIVNFQRGSSGHFSPLAAYDRISQSVLVMDTNPSQQKWHWKDIEELFELMETRDGANSRGLLSIFNSSCEPPPSR